MSRYCRAEHSASGALGANIYWVSLVLKLRHLLSEAPEESLAA